jgi:hypothetical protein
MGMTQASLDSRVDGALPEKHFHLLTYPVILPQLRISCLLHERPG